MNCNWLKTNFIKQYPLIGFGECVTVKEVITRARRYSSDPAVQANLVSNRLRLLIKKDVVSIEEVINYCRNSKKKYVKGGVKGRMKRSNIRYILLNLLEVMAEYEYRNKNQVRSIITLLYQLYPNAPETMRREVFFFEYAYCRNSITEEKNTEKQFYKKLNFMVDMVACWSPPNIQLLDSDQVKCATYLDFPLTYHVPVDRPDVRNDYTLIDDSIYGLRNVDLTLYMLRCGTSVSGSILWTLAFNLDLHLQTDFQQLDLCLNCNVNVGRIIRYFCRTKRWIYLCLTSKDGLKYTIPKRSIIMEGTVSKKDIFILPKTLKRFVPVDRYKELTRLLHLCRLTIRKALEKAEQLPDGPQKLPLPASLKNYIDLLED